MWQAFWDKAILLIKLNIKNLIVVFTIALFILFAPDSLLKVLSLNELSKSAWRPFFGFIALATGISIIYFLLGKIYFELEQWVNLWRLKRKIIKEISHFNFEQKLILHFSVKANIGIVIAPINNPYVRDLCRKGMLIEETQITDMIRHRFSIPGNILEILKSSREKIFGEFEKLKDEELLNKLKEILRLG